MSDEELSMCSGCGQRGVKIERPGYAEGLWRWFNDGPPFRRRSYTCRACGYSLINFSRRRGPLSDAVATYRRLASQRTMHPVPRTYALAIVAGALLGLVLQTVTGLRWWEYAVLAFVATWLFFMSTSFWGGRSRP